MISKIFSLDPNRFAVDRGNRRATGKAGKVGQEGREGGMFDFYFQRSEFSLRFQGS
jgi:hypothetical protein